MPCRPPADPPLLLLRRPSGLHEVGALAAEVDVTVPTMSDAVAALAEDGTIAAARACTTCRYFRRDVVADPAAPHFCGLLEQPLALIDLRVDCPEHAAG